MPNLRSVGGGRALCQSCTVQVTCKRESMSVTVFTTSSSLLFISVSILHLSAGCNSPHQWGCFKWRSNVHRQMSRVYSTKAHRIVLDNGGRGTDSALRVSHTWMPACRGPSMGKLSSASVGWQHESLWRWLVTATCSYHVKGVDNTGDQMWVIVRSW